MPSWACRRSPPVGRIRRAEVRMTAPGCIYRFRLGRDASGAYVGRAGGRLGVDDRSPGRGGRPGWDQGLRGHEDADE